MNENQLNFYHYTPGQTLVKNRFGIPEPVGNNKAIKTKQLDLVFMPLVAFDRRGSRLGMGGGFYDRTFEFTKQSISQHSPLLVGLAHQCQQAMHLPSQSWDIPLNMIVTDKQILHPQRIY